MTISPSSVLEYSINTPQMEFDLNPLIGEDLKISFTGKINCVNCNNLTNKSFNQGHCFTCFQTLPGCDMCMMSPEKCHFSKGTCRDESFAQNFCFQPHTVYLSETSDVKVGITRSHQKLTRWMDQGAVQAIEVLQVFNRFDSGKVECALKSIFKDKTNWRGMLKDTPPSADLLEQKQIFIDKLESLDLQVDLKISNENVHTFNYPIERYPEKIKSFNADKEDVIEGTFHGIKGQYLFIGERVINIRRHQGYEAILDI
jgi:hypothetical protein